MNVSLAVSCALVAGAAVAVPVVAASASVGASTHSAAPAASLKLTAGTALPGQAVKFTGSGFKAREVVTVSWRKAGGTKLAQVKAGSKGAIAGTFTVPRPTGGGSKLDVVAVGATSKKQAKFLFTESCTDEWTNLKGGNWAKPSNWSAGAVPGPSTAACITLPSAKKYTVVYNQLTGSTTVGSLQVGAPGGKGAQVLGVDGAGADSSITLEHTSTIRARGVVTLSSAGSSNAFLKGPGVLDNYGLLETLPGKGWSRYLDGHYVNEKGGTFKVAAGLYTYQRAGSTFVNLGTIDVAKGSWYYEQQAMFSQAGGHVANSGTVRLDGGTLKDTGGTATGSAWVLDGTTLKDKAGTGSFTFVDNGVIGGIIPAGQTVTVNGDTGENVRLALRGDLTNNGKIVLTSSPGVNNSPTNAWLVGAAGTRLLNYGTVLTAPGAGFSRYFAVQVVNEKTGTITLDSASNTEGGSYTITNNGKLNLGPGAWLYLNGDVNGSADLVDSATSTTNVAIGARPSYIKQNACSAGACQTQAIHVAGTLAVTANGTASGTYAAIYTDLSPVTGSFAKSPAGYVTSYNVTVAVNPDPADTSAVVGDVTVSAP